MVEINIEKFERFLRTQRGLRDNSIRHTLSRTNLYLAWLKKQNLQIDKDSALDYIDQFKQKGTNNNTINCYIFALRKLWDYFEDDEIPIKPLKLKSLPKVKKPIKILSIEEIKLIASTNLEYGTFRGKQCNRLNNTYRTFIWFLGLTGCRYSEAANLKVKNLDLISRTAYFEQTKNGDWRKGYLSNALVTMLKDLLYNDKKNDPEDYVFTNMTGHPIRPQEFSTDLKQRARRAGVYKPVRPHVFRHSFATQLITDRVPIEKVALIIGHKDIQTTYNNYIHLADEILRESAYKHKLNRKSIEVNEVLKIAYDMIEDLGIRSDKRFIHTLKSGDGELVFSLKAKKEYLK